MRREDGRRLVEAATAAGVRIGVVPDTFLGDGIQTCRRIIDAGGWRCGPPSPRSAGAWASGAAGIVTTRVEPGSAQGEAGNRSGPRRPPHRRVGRCSHDVIRMPSLTSQRDRRHLQVLVAAVLANYLAQVPYDLHLYGLTGTNPRGVLLLGATLRDSPR